MAMRRARVKLAPNLGARNKPRNVVPLKPKIDISKLVEESSEASDYDEELNKSANDIGIKQVQDKPTNACDKSEVNLHSKAEEAAEVAPNDFDIVAKSIGTISPPNSSSNGVDDSDWEDDQFSYKTVDANTEARLYKSLEITPLKEVSRPVEEIPPVEITPLKEVSLPPAEVSLNLKVESLSSESSSLLTGAEDLNSTLKSNCLSNGEPEIAKDDNQNIKSTAPKIQGSPAKASRVRLPLSRNKVKPNLSVGRRPNRPTLPAKALTASTAVEAEAKSPVKPGVQDPEGTVSWSPARSLSKSPIRSSSRSPSSYQSPCKIVNSDSDPDDPKLEHSPPPQVRKLSRNISVKPLNPSKVLHDNELVKQPDDQKRKMLKRKLDHKRKFMKGVPDRSAMTMFDLIYYNPDNGTRMSVDEDENPQNLKEPENSEKFADSEPSKDVSTPDAGTDRGDEEENEMPVPQVKVDANGEIVIDDASLTVETTEVRKAKDTLQNSPIVFEGSRSSTNYGTWSKKRRHSDWGKRETLKFYKALSVVGSDFSMMESLFQGKRSRQELKLKFKKEEKINGKIVDKCLRERGMFTEYKDIMEDSEEDEVIEEERKKKKRHNRRRYVNRGYYDTSSDDECLEVDPKSSKTPTRKRIRGEAFSISRNQPVVRIKRPRVMEEKLKQSQSTSTSSSTVTRTCVKDLKGSITIGKDGVTGSPGVSFPPGLLAANPGLVGARPGSLVVVASPNKTDPSNQLLHVYMVASKKVKDKSSTPSTSKPFTRSTDSLVLDPAVVRAVDRGRLRNMSGPKKNSTRSRTYSESTEAFGRNRTVSESVNSTSECSTKSAKDTTQRIHCSRQRTYSEGSCRELRTRVANKQLSEGVGRSVAGISPTATSVELPIAKKSLPPQDEI